MAIGPGQSGPARSQDPSESDCEVALRFSRGEAEAFALVVAAHQDRLARLVHRLLGWRGEVEDVVQDVLLAAWTKRRQLRDPGRLASWLAAIAVNRCRNVRRWRFLRGLLLGDSDERVAAGDAGDAGAAAGPPALSGRRTGAGEAAGANDVAHASSAAEMAERVRQAVRALPGRLREAAVLKYLEQLELDEICRVLRIRPGAARVRLHRARELLRKSLADLVEDDE
jgi:RNA polymerase sigma factor (sigma-70 family)